MDFFPNFGRPYYYSGMPNRYISPRYRNNYYNSEKDSSKRAIEEERTSREEKEETSRGIGFGLNFKDDQVFEIFGIKLSFDDILIVALIFFLYNEGVRDNLLFISLILILLS